MTKRATSEEHIKDIFSRFKKTSKGWVCHIYHFSETQFTNFLFFKYAFK